MYVENNVLQLTYRHTLIWRRMTDKMTWTIVTSNIASARNQWYLKDSVFRMAQMTLYSLRVNYFSSIAPRAIEIKISIARMKF